MKAIALCELCANSSLISHHLPDSGAELCCEVCVCIAQRAVSEAAHREASSTLPGDARGALVWA